MRLSESTSISHRVTSILRQKILSREFEPGLRMVEAKVAKSLGVSITPVREAFAILVKQGLLTSFPYCGTYVTILTQESAAELIKARKEIEAAAVRMAFPNLCSEDADYLYELCRKSDECDAAGNQLESIEYDIEFHEFFFKKADNKLVLEMWDIIRNRIAFFQYITRPNNQAASRHLVDRHKGIIDAVRAMDEGLIISQIKNHLDTAMKRSGLPRSEDICYK